MGLDIVKAGVFFRSLPASSAPLSVPFTVWVTFVGFSQRSGSSVGVSLSSSLLFLVFSKVTIKALLVLRVCF